MRYAAQLLGEASSLERVAPCFQGPSANIRKIGEDWFLESSSFEPCPEPNDVFPLADKIVLAILRICMLYAWFLPSEQIKVGYVQAFDAVGVRTKRVLRSSAKIYLYLQEGLEELQKPHGTQSFGSVIVEHSISDTNLEEALSLIGEGQLGWPQLYNILEFLGGDNAVVKRQWGVRSEITGLRQTANHFRHLGSPKKYPLPSNAPSLGVGRKLIFNLLKKWIATQF